MGKAKAKADTVTKTETVPLELVPVEVVSAKKTPRSSTKAAAKVPSTKGKVQEVAVVVDSNVVVDETESTEAVFTESFTEFMAKLQTLCSQMNALKSEFRMLEKKAVREIKVAQKVNAKRKRKTSNRSPSGFVKPTLISTELATFLNKPAGTEMARTEVTREINGYIRAHNLQDKQNGRKINPDSSLATLLKIGSGEELTYFNLQRYMSPHFAKASSKVPPVEVEAAAAAALAAGA